MPGHWTYKDFVKDALSRVPEMSCEDLARSLHQSDLAVLDVREADEMTSGTLPGAIMLSRGLLEKHVSEHLPSRETKVVIFCATGNRSALAGDVLLRMGYTDVWNLAGGMERWRHLGLPIEGGGAVCRLPGARLNWTDVRAGFEIVSRHVPVLGSGERQLVYLDHAASTHAPVSVLNAYVEFLAREYANIHRGTHHLSRKATERFEEAYYIVADFIGAELKKGCVCFSANTTTAIDLASHVMADRPGKVITTEMEHHSNELPHRRRGSVLRARVLDDGSLDLTHLEELLRKHDVKLVAVTAGSNVTGIMPDIHRIARLAHENGALILVDAAQALARMPIDVKPFENPEHLDFLAGAGHKAYAPMGAGFLYGPRDLMNDAPPYVSGGGTAAQVTARGVEFMPAPDRHHGGTPNIAGVFGMSRALLFLSSIGREEIRAHEIDLMTKMLDGLRAIGDVTVYGPADPTLRLGVCAFNVAGVSELLTAAVLSEEGALAVRSGRFCAHLYVDRLLQLYHHGAADAPTGAVRASVGLYTDESDVDRLLEFVQRVKDREWKGRYRTRGDGEAITAEFAGRCADRWMESTHEADAPAMIEVLNQEYEFEVLQPDGACRSYFLADPVTKEAALVDPLRENVDQYLDLLMEKRYKLRYVIETHTHADHLSGSVRLKDLTGATMIMHQNSPAPCVDRKLKDGDLLELGRVRLEVIATAGHTIDSMCLLLPGRVLTGDTLLIGSCGRSDLPTGSASELYDSLKRLSELPPETMVFPAHDYNGQRASTIARELKTNPRLKLDLTTFVAVQESIDVPAPANMLEAVTANTRCL